MERGQLRRLTKGRRITSPEREKVTASLLDRYAQGASIRDLMEVTSRSYGWVHRLLRESGGRQAHRMSPDATDSALPLVVTPPRSRGVDSDE